MEWATDILGADFQSCTIETSGADGTMRRATVVRYRPDSLAAGTGKPRTVHGAVLFLHGWSDYFFNKDLARFWARLGYEFYALDMHNHGRNLDEATTGGYVADLADYDAEITMALDIIRADHTGSEQPGIALMGHSTGGLVAALWASRHPGSVQYLILNSPWLEMHGNRFGRRAAQAMVAPLARFRPEMVLRLPERGFYFRSISITAEGEWPLDERYRPPFAFPVRAGWLRAVLAGHAKVDRGLELDIPVLVLTSAASANGMVWQESMRRSDAVLDVDVIAARVMALGRSVTLERVEGGLHDVFLSAPKVREDAYARLARWIHGYMETGPSETQEKGDT
ncbi:alpha/beta hydrolase [Paenarthrobacter ureafaciens]|jgi:alpha-beta hydrolase superfamily lysophospholipase|nr:alpha/beta hydrolase [Paenarthrobacter sp. PAE-2]MCW3766235.1 alpha/beta hydrolase [Paenarthrobacter sp. PAE-2]